MLVAEPRTEPPETADHLVADEQDIALAANAGDLRPVGLRRDDDAAGSLDRFRNEGGNALLADLIDLLFQFARRFEAAFGGREIAALGIPVGLGDVVDALKSDDTTSALQSLMRISNAVFC